jgi:3-methyladenine DNA glycosylase Mpg
MIESGMCGYARSVIGKMHIRNESLVDAEADIDSNDPAARSSLGITGERAEMVERPGAVRIRLRVRQPQIVR